MLPYREQCKGKKWVSTEREESGEKDRSCGCIEEVSKTARNWCPRRICLRGGDREDAHGGQAAPRTKTRKQIYKTDMGLPYIEGREIRWAPSY